MCYFILFFSIQCEFVASLKKSDKSYDENRFSASASYLMLVQIEGGHSLEETHTLSTEQECSEILKGLCSVRKLH